MASIMYNQERNANQFNQHLSRYERAGGPPMPSNGGFADWSFFDGYDLNCDPTDQRCLPGPDVDVWAYPCEPEFGSLMSSENQERAPSDTRHGSPLELQAAPSADLHAVGKSPVQSQSYGASDKVSAFTEASTKRTLDIGAEMEMYPSVTSKRSKRNHRGYDNGIDNETITVKYTREDVSPQHVIRTASSDTQPEGALRHRTAGNENKDSSIVNEDLRQATEDNARSLGTAPSTEPDDVHSDQIAGPSTQELPHDDLSSVQEALNTVLHAVSTAHREKFVYVIDSDLPNKLCKLAFDAWQNSITHVVKPIVQLDACTIIIATRGEVEVEILTTRESLTREIKRGVEEAILVMRTQSTPAQVCTSPQYKLMSHSVPRTHVHSPIEFALPVLWAFIRSLLDLDVRSDLGMCFENKEFLQLMNPSSRVKEELKQELEELSQLNPKDLKFNLMLESITTKYKPLLQLGQKVPQAMKRILDAPGLGIRNKDLEKWKSWTSQVYQYQEFLSGLPLQVASIIRTQPKAKVKKTSVDKLEYITNMREEEVQKQEKARLWLQEMLDLLALIPARLATKIQEAMTFYVGLERTMKTLPNSELPTTSSSAPL